MSHLRYTHTHTQTPLLLRCPGPHRINHSKADSKAPQPATPQAVNALLPPCSSLTQTPLQLLGPPSRLTQPARVRPSRMLPCPALTCVDTERSVRPHTHTQRPARVAADRVSLVSSTVALGVNHDDQVRCVLLPLAPPHCVHALASDASSQTTACASREVAGARAPSHRLRTQTRLSSARPRDSFRHYRRRRQSRRRRRRRRRQ